MHPDSQLPTEEQRKKLCEMMHWAFLEMRQLGASGRAEQAGDLAERLLKIGKDCAAHLKEPFLTVDHGDLLYDEQGLPK